MLDLIRRLHASHVSHDMPPRIRLRTAYHEAGHAYIMSSFPLWKDVSIKLDFSGGLAKSKYNQRERFTDAEAGWLITRMLLAGLSVEQFYFGAYSKYGCVQDILGATELAVTRLEALHDFVFSNKIEYASETTSLMLPEDSPYEIKVIFSAAIRSNLYDIYEGRDIIRDMGKHLYKKAYLSNKDIRQIFASHGKKVMQ